VADNTIRLSGKNAGWVAGSGRILQENNEQIYKWEYLKQFRLPIKFSIIVRPEKELVSFVACL